MTAPKTAELEEVSLVGQDLGERRLPWRMQPVFRFLVDFPDLVRPNNHPLFFLLRSHMSMWMGEKNEKK